jgi:hypothetical protein
MDPLILRSKMGQAERKASGSGGRVIPDDLEGGLRRGRIELRQRIHYTLGRQDNDHFRSLPHFRP